MVNETVKLVYMPTTVVTVAQESSYSFDVFLKASYKSGFVISLKARIREIGILFCCYTLNI